MNAQWIVWAETTSTHSTWIAARCTNHVAASAVANAIRESGIIASVQSPEHTYRSN